MEAQLRFPEMVCDSCGQGTHAYERAKLPSTQELVIWNKYDKDKETGARVKPSGLECRPCFDTREGNFGKMDVHLLGSEQPPAANDEQPVVSRAAAINRQRAINQQPAVADKQAATR